MAQTTRQRRRGGAGRSDRPKLNQGSSTNKRPATAVQKQQQQQQQSNNKSSRGSLKNNRREEEEPERRRRQEEPEEEQVDNEELYKVEKIVGFKTSKGVPLYKTRWKGYGASDDTWEPVENVASTGHLDRYERRMRGMTLSRQSPGVAVIDYEDGERETVDMKREKFRGYLDLSDDEVESDAERDDDTVNGDDDVNNFDLVAVGRWIEILWRHTNMYFPCKIVSWTPLLLEEILLEEKKADKNQSSGNEVKDGSGSSSRVGVVVENVKKAAPVSEVPTAKRNEIPPAQERKILEQKSDSLKSQRGGDNLMGSGRGKRKRQFGPEEPTGENDRPRPTVTREEARSKKPLTQNSEVPAEPSSAAERNVGGEIVRREENGRDGLRTTQEPSERRPKDGGWHDDFDSDDDSASSSSSMVAMEWQW